MAKKKKEAQTPKIPVNEIELGGVYKNYVNELVRVEEINTTTNEVVLYNITGSHKQWINFKHVYLVEKVRQSR